jgi:hypothetical protein
VEGGSGGGGEADEESNWIGPYLLDAARVCDQGAGQLIDVTKDTAPSKKRIHGVLNQVAGGSHGAGRGQARVIARRARSTSTA